jgi:uncharacterized membrane protein
MAQHATTLPEQQHMRATKQYPRNVSDLERGLSLIGGTALVLYGLRRSLGNLALMLGGGALMYRGLTGYCAAYQALGVNTARNDMSRGVALRATITVNKPAAEVYRFWRHLENHPRFMQHLESVVSTNGKRSHWVAKAPLPTPIEWDADIVTERENALLSWRSLPGADVEHAGTVRFRELPNRRGTEVRVRLEYAPPGGVVGVAVANLFKTLTEQQLKEDLRRFKQIIETGETPTADYAQVAQGVSH